MNLVASQPLSWSLPTLFKLKLEFGVIVLVERVRRENPKKNILRKEENQNKLKQVYFIKRCHLLQILSKVNKNCL